MLCNVRTLRCMLDRDAAMGTRDSTAAELLFTCREQSIRESHPEGPQLQQALQTFRQVGAGDCDDIAGDYTRQMLDPIPIGLGKFGCNKTWQAHARRPASQLLPQPPPARSPAAAAAPCAAAWTRRCW